MSRPTVGEMTSGWNTKTDTLGVEAVSDDGGMSEIFLK